MSTLKTWDKNSALKGLLKRTPLEEYPVPAEVMAKIKEVFGSPLSPSQVVDQIICLVKERGDEALLELSEKIDGYRPDSLEVSPQQIEGALNAVPPAFLSALRTAAERIKAFYQQITLPQMPGAILRPLSRIGVYIPAGYFSTVLMTVIPAKVAGVKEVFIATPAKKVGVDVKVLTAVGIAGADRVFQIGGAQAIAALALGTKTIPQVDKICGPGNIFVQLAKKRLYGIVDIDGLYGPSELMVLSDGTSTASICAAELLAQLEHDPLSSAILITVDPGQARAVLEEIDRLLPDLSRRPIITQALDRSGIVIVDSLEEGIELVNYYAPEHLLLLLEEPDKYLKRITNAGSISVNSPVGLVDYIWGPSHVLPTGGTARFFSFLNPLHFLKLIPITSPSTEEIKRLIPAAGLLAETEGLSAHALALKRWENFL